jgi:hypothetical protein
VIITHVICPGCGLELPGDALADGWNASAACRAAYDELAGGYTLTLGDAEFIHQLAVDAYAATHVLVGSKPITAVFAVVGLYLVNERGYTGRQAQLAHMRMARTPKQWPRLQPPDVRASMTVWDVLQTPAQRRQSAIKQWSAAVWQTWQPRCAEVERLAREYAGWI